MENNLLSTGGPMLDVVNRRFFLRSAGVAASTGALIMGCTLVDHNLDKGIDLGMGDTGILNYAYALEQLEAAFYMQVLKTPYDGMSMKEKDILTDIMYHEIIHRQFFKAALGGNAIKGLTPNFSLIKFNDRASVLGYAKIFEDKGVGAYNGAGNLISSPVYLTIAGKIVSVEARHASVIRDLLNPNSKDFAGDDIVVKDGLDVAETPAKVLMDVQPFIMEKIDGSNLPK